MRKKESDNDTMNERVGGLDSPHRDAELINRPMYTNQIKATMVHDCAIPPLSLESEGPDAALGRLKIPAHLSVQQVGIIKYAIKLIIEAHGTEVSANVLEKVKVDSGPEALILPKSVASQLVMEFQAVASSMENEASWQERNWSSSVTNNPRAQISLTEALKAYDVADPAVNGVRVTLNGFFRDRGSIYEHLLWKHQARCSGQPKALIKFPFKGFNLSYATFVKSVITGADFCNAYVFCTDFTHAAIGHCNITEFQLATSRYDVINRQNCRKIIKAEAKAGVMKGVNAYLESEYKKDKQANTITERLDSLSFFIGHEDWVKKKISKHPKFENEPERRVNERVFRQLKFFQYLKEVRETQTISTEADFQIQRRSF